MNGASFCKRQHSLVSFHQECIRPSKCWIGSQNLLLRYIVDEVNLHVWRAGKTFFAKKKQPIPVDLTHKDWAAQVRRATEATYMFHTGGTCLNIRWGSHLYYTVLLLCCCSRILREASFPSRITIIWPGTFGRLSTGSRCGLCLILSFCARKHKAMICGVILQVSCTEVILGSPWCWHVQTHC